MKPCHLIVLTAVAACAPVEAPEAVETSGAEAEPADPRVVGEEVSYQAGDTTLKGYLAWDAAKQGPRPGVIVVHEWWGHNDYVRRRATMLAQLGYTALAIDMYGDGKNTEHPADARAFMTAALKDPAAAKARFDAGLDLLMKHQSTDPERTAAIGYCFGGAVALNMARAGADLDVIASFHGSLGTQAPAAAGSILGEVWVFTGEADTMIPAEQVEAFRREMQLAGARHTIVSYPGATHAFTNPAATERGKKTGVPIAYDAGADADSWAKLTEVLAATFGKPEPDAEAKQRARSAAEARGRLAQLERDIEQERTRWTEQLRAEAKQLAEASYRSTRAGLRKIMKGAHRMAGNADRDAVRKPIETLEFFGIRPDMTVLEYGPGAGWYTELLAPLLAKRGKLIVNNGDPDGPRDNRGTYYAKRLQAFIDKAPELYGQVQIARTDDPKNPALGLEGTLDAALVIRGYHGWKRRDAVGPWLAQIHRSLKPGGTLGIVQHRAAKGDEPKASAEKGRLPEAVVIAEVEAAGFKLVKSSELHANPRDTRGYPEGVWTLPPTLRLGDVDREKYLAIGESDRMTLKFVRVP